LKTRWLAVFAGCFAAAALRSLSLGKDANWDLKNYHWYNAWALLNGRMGWDLAPAQIQTYYNPVGDLPFHFLVQWLPWPRHVAVWMALPAAIAIFFLIRIAVLLFPPGRERGNLAWIVAGVAIGATGAAGQATIGSTMNEWLCAAFLMAGVWLALRDERGYLAGSLLVGCAVGLKLTYGVFAFGFVAALLVQGAWRERLRRAALASALVLCGYLAFGGYWAWVLWREFGNPVFPYYNHIFKSPWWEPIAFFDRNWGPRDFWQWLFFPLYFARHSSLVSEVGFRDYRLAALLVLALLAAVKWIASKGLPLPWVRAGERVRFHFLAAFTFFSYLAWLVLFGIYRYLVPLEIVSGPLIVGALLYLFRGMRLRYASAAILAILLVGTTRHGDWGRVPFGRAYFETVAPELPPNALVIVGYYNPYSYELPFLRTDARFVSPANNFLLPEQGNLLARRVGEVVRGHAGPIFLLEMKRRLGRDEQTLAFYGLGFAPAPCREIRSPMADNFEQLCALRRLGPA
jgi:hypothetical protein